MRLKTAKSAPQTPFPAGKQPISTELWPVDRPIDYPKNARKWGSKAVSKVAQSLWEFGFRQPIVVDAHDVICIGHLRRAAAREAGFTQVPVHVAADLTAAQIRQLRIMDNRSHEEADWNMDILADEMKELAALDLDLTLTGFDRAEFVSFMAGSGLTDPDEVPPEPARPVTVPGDLWLLGDHRLLCGDATVLEDVKRALAGRVGDLVFTDPPYGVAVASRIGTRGVSSAEARELGTNQIVNDDISLPALTEFLRTVFTNLLAATRPGACWYVCAPHGPMGLAFSVTLGELDVWRHSLVWVKDSLVMGRMDYHYRHEPIYYGWSPGAARHAVPTRDQDTVWEFDRPKRSLEHPTMKPVELVVRAIQNSTNAGDLVLDTFGGSGTTIVAAETSQRVCCSMELEPKYVDVMVARWQNFTGKEATLEADGRTFAAVAAERLA